MGKVRKTQVLRGNEILWSSQYAAASVTVSDVGVAAVDEVRVVKAGTIVGGVGGKRLSDPGVQVTESNGSGAEGVLLYDVDVTNGPCEGSMVIFGFVKLEGLPAAPSAAAVAALKMVMFLA